MTGPISRAAVVLAFATGILVYACPSGASERLKVVVSFSILADVVENIGGERIEISTLVGRNGDSHVYVPTPADVRKVADAKLVFVNGLGLEGWLPRLVKSSGNKGSIVTASKGISQRRAANGHSHDHEDSDPHAWQSVANVKIYATNIRDALIASDSVNEGFYRSSAEKYLAKLDALDRDVRDSVAKIPMERRKVISTHDAFGYFSAAYGIAFIAPQGVSTESEPSARDVATIISQIRKQKIPAVFLENAGDPRLMQRISAETGAKIGGTLYSDSLTEENGAAPTYIDMVRHNIKALSSVLSN